MTCESHPFRTPLVECALSRPDEHGTHRIWGLRLAKPISLLRNQIRVFSGLLLYRNPCRGSF